MHPNIIYILADDMGFGDIQCLNPEGKIPTPNLDRLASEGCAFVDAHSNSAVCTPTRYGVMTGRYTWRGKLKSGVLSGYDPLLIESGRLTVGKLLQQAGYTTACVGKWHLGLDWKSSDGQPVERASENADFASPIDAGAHTVGFDYSYIIPSSLDITPYCYIEDGKVLASKMEKIPESRHPDFWRGGWAEEGFSFKDCLHTLTKKAVEVIEGQKDSGTPFFLYFPLTSPHTPHTPRDEFRGSTPAGPYGDLMAETDWTVGQIMQAVEKIGQVENTIFIVTSDNGAHESINGADTACGHQCNHIFAGQKSDAWDGGHHVPFIARWPKELQAGTRCEQIICLTDLMATMAELTGQTLPSDAGEDSVSMLSLLKGEQTPVRENVVHHSIRGDFALRTQQHKFIECRGSGGWTLKEEDAPASPPYQLYDMLADPSEQKNLYNEQTELAEQMQATLDEIRGGRDANRPVRKT